ncbi:hypothetical protein CTEN210_13264 [Chaetoceros tenuissimus]|uniref:Circumsporozoite protein n=1 Tax=Chaetoceros tenuissimus TaxID=426638 RepID=A0AAD3D321_9STRA|nr:hypothetical protein CTEN210_13264 [Chaetoceros tenuissimus]
MERKKRKQGNNKKKRRPRSPSRNKASRNSWTSSITVKNNNQREYERVHDDYTQGLKCGDTYTVPSMDKVTKAPSPTRARAPQITSWNGNVSVTGFKNQELDKPSKVGFAPAKAPSKQDDYYHVSKGTTYVYNPPSCNTHEPSSSPAFSPVKQPQVVYTPKEPTQEPVPSLSPSISSKPTKPFGFFPIQAPSAHPTLSTVPSLHPTDKASSVPSISSKPTKPFGFFPIEEPSAHPTLSAVPSLHPTDKASSVPSISSKPTKPFGFFPIEEPSAHPTLSAVPSLHPSNIPSFSVSSGPSKSHMPTTSCAVPPPRCSLLHVDDDLPIEREDGTVIGNLSFVVCRIVDPAGIEEDKYHWELRIDCFDTVMEKINETENNRKLQESILGNIQVHVGFVAPSNNPYEFDLQLRDTLPFENDKDLVAEGFLICGEDFFFSLHLRGNNGESIWAKEGDENNKSRFTSFVEGSGGSSDYSMYTLCPFDSTIEPSTSPSVASWNVTEFPTTSTIPSTQPFARSSEPSLSTKDSSSIPSKENSLTPSERPSLQQKEEESSGPTTTSSQPTGSLFPSLHPENMPSMSPSAISQVPSAQPISTSSNPSHETKILSISPSVRDSFAPSEEPSLISDEDKTSNPTISKAPSENPSHTPVKTSSPVPSVSIAPSILRSTVPSVSSEPSHNQSFIPSMKSSTTPSKLPSILPSSKPTLSFKPSIEESSRPTIFGTFKPSESSSPSDIPSKAQTSVMPSNQPSKLRSDEPSLLPSNHTSSSPSILKTNEPSSLPTYLPSVEASVTPSIVRSDGPSYSPSSKPTSIDPSNLPTKMRSDEPSSVPSVSLSVKESSAPSFSTAPTLVSSNKPSVSSSPTTRYVCPAMSVEYNLCLQRGNYKNSYDEVGVVKFAVSTVNNEYVWELRIENFVDDIVGYDILRHDTPENIKAYVGSSPPSSNAGSYNYKFTDSLPYTYDEDLIAFGGLSCDNDLYFGVHLDAETGDTIWAIPCSDGSSADVPYEQFKQGWGGYSSYSAVACSDCIEGPGPDVTAAPVGGFPLPPTSLPTAASVVPSVLGSDGPSLMPSNLPTEMRSDGPSSNPSSGPSSSPSALRSDEPSLLPSNLPTKMRSEGPSLVPSNSPSSSPSLLRSDIPSVEASITPSIVRSDGPSYRHSNQPSSSPSVLRSDGPSLIPTNLPTKMRSDEPSLLHSNLPSSFPSSTPSVEASITPSIVRSDEPSYSPSSRPSVEESSLPSLLPSMDPSNLPTKMRSDKPSSVPLESPSVKESSAPSLTSSSIPTLVSSNKPSVSSSPTTRYVCPAMSVEYNLCLQRGNYQNKYDEVGVMKFAVSTVNNEYVWELRIENFVNDIVGGNVLRRDTPENIKAYVGSSIPGSNPGSYNYKFTDSLPYTYDEDLIAFGGLSCDNDLYFGVHLDAETGDTIWAIPCSDGSSTDVPYEQFKQGWGGYSSYSAVACSDCSDGPGPDVTAAPVGGFPLPPTSLPTAASVIPSVLGSTSPSSAPSFTSPSIPTLSSSNKPSVSSSPTTRYVCPAMSVEYNLCLQRGNYKNSYDEVGKVKFAVSTVNNEYVWELRIENFVNDIVGGNVLRRDTPENIKAYVGSSIPGSNPGSYNYKFTDSLPYTYDEDLIAFGGLSCDNDLYFGVHLDAETGDTIWAIPCSDGSSTDVPYEQFMQGWGGYSSYSAVACSECENDTAIRRDLNSDERLELESDSESQEELLDGHRRLSNTFQQFEVFHCLFDDSDTECPYCLPCLSECDDECGFFSYPSEEEMVTCLENLPKECATTCKDVCHGKFVENLFEAPMNEMRRSLLEKDKDDTLPGSTCSAEDLNQKECPHCETCLAQCDDECIFYGSGSIEEWNTCFDNISDECIGICWDVCKKDFAESYLI